MRPTLAVFAVAVLLLVATSSSASPGRPNDPAWPTQWGPVLTHTDAVWKEGTGSSAIVIAVVDTGVVQIPDLEGAVVGGADLLGPSRGDGAEYAYHGTWVASIIAARGDNGRGAAGYCWRCSIMSVRVSDGTTPADTSRIAQGIRWAVDHGARIVNVSLAGSGPSGEEEAAVAYATEHNVLVVASAGNGGGDEHEYPGAYPGVLAVAGTDQQDRLYPWATRGAWVTLAAPGCATVGDPRGAAYGCGSSYAPAAISGIAGLLLSFDPTLSAAQLAAALRSSAHPVQGIGGGRVDAAAAFAALALHATNAPSPVSSPAPATAAAPLQVTEFRGTLNGSRSLAFTAGAGQVVVRLRVRPSTSCSLLLQLGSSAVFAVGEPPSVVAAAPKAGLKRVTITCAATRSVDYTLQIERRSAAP